MNEREAQHIPQGPSQEQAVGDVVQKSEGLDPIARIEQEASAEKRKQLLAEFLQSFLNQYKERKEFAQDGDFSRGKESRAVIPTPVIDAGLTLAGIQKPEIHGQFSEERQKNKEFLRSLAFLCEENMSLAPDDAFEVFAWMKENMEELDTAQVLALIRAIVFNGTLITGNTVEDYYAYEDFRYGILKNEVFLRKLREAVIENKEDVPLMLNTLDYLQISYSDTDEEDVAYPEKRDIHTICGELLEEIKKTAQNFFVKEKIQFIEKNPLDVPGFHLDDIGELQRQYHDPRLALFYELASHFPEREDPDQFANLDRFGNIHGSLSKGKYGIVYNDDGRVKGCFLLDEKTERESPDQHNRFYKDRIFVDPKDTCLIESLKQDFGDTKKITPVSERKEFIKTPVEVVTLEKILEREGFNKTKMKEKEYQQLLATYEALMEIPLRHSVEERFGIRLEEYSVREQVQFVNFLSRKDTAGVEEVQKFVDASHTPVTKRNRLQSFLSLEAGAEMGEKIMAIGSIMPTELADQIFASYAELVSVRDKRLEDILSILNNPKDIRRDDIRAIAERVLERANAMLISFASQVAEEGGNEGVSHEGVLEELNYYHRDILFTMELLKQMTVEGRDDIKDFKNISIEETTAERIFGRPKEIKQAEKIYRDNYLYAPKLANIAWEGFEAVQGRDDVIVIVFNHKDDHGQDRVVAFDRFDPMPSEAVDYPEPFMPEDKRDTLYFAAVNVMPSIQGTRLFPYLMRESLEQKAKKHSILALSNARQFVCEAYIERYGFVGYELEPDYEETKTDLLKISRRESNKRFQTRGWGIDVIRGWFQEKFSTNEYIGNAPIIILKLTPGTQEFNNILKDLLDVKHYKLTRYVIHKKNMNMKEKHNQIQEVYCVFERGFSSS